MKGLIIRAIFLIGLFFGLIGCDVQLNTIVIVEVITFLVSYIHVLGIGALDVVGDVFEGIFDSFGD